MQDMKEEFNKDWEIQKKIKMKMKSSITQIKGLLKLKTQLKALLMEWNKFEIENQ
jgi:hypothetical protein